MLFALQILCGRRSLLGASSPPRLCQSTRLIPGGALKTSLRAPYPLSWSAPPHMDPESSPHSEVGPLRSAAGVLRFASLFQCCQLRGGTVGQVSDSFRECLQECNWIVSGDGDHERQAVTLADGRQIARAWHEADGVAGWVPCAVTPKTQSQSRWGAIYNDTFRYTDYQALTAGESPSHGNY